VTACNYSRELRSAKWGFRVSSHGNNPEPLMSGLGQKQTLSRVYPMSAIPPKADIVQYDYNVRFVPKANIALRHSITSSARPIAFALAMSEIGGART
jgi:hypothetical protein